MVEYLKIYTDTEDLYSDHIWFTVVLPKLLGLLKVQTGYFLFKIEVNSVKLSKAYKSMASIIWFHHICSQCF